MLNGHGGNIYDIAHRLGCAPSEIIDMSSNVNPLGPPPGLVDFLKENLNAITASKTIIETLARYSLPWSVNALAQAGVRYLMEHNAEVKLLDLS